MDFLYPRICEVTYGDVNYDNYDTYTYYNELDYTNHISNQNYFLVDDDNDAIINNNNNSNNDDEINLVWRYSSKHINKKPDPIKWPKLNKSYSTLVDNNNANNESFGARRTNYFVQNAHSASTLPKSKSRLNLAYSLNESAEPSQAIQFADDTASSNQVNARLFSRSNTDILKYRKSAAYNNIRQLKSAKINNELYIEYINVVNNPIMHPKYLSETSKYKSSNKKMCDRLLRDPGSGSGSSKLIHDLTHKNQMRNLDAINLVNRKKGEVTLTDKLKPITNTNQDSMNKLKTEIKIKEKIPKIPPKEATPTVPYRPKIVQKPKLTVAEVDRFDSYKMKPSAKVDNMEAEERDLFYTDVDVVANRRQRMSRTSNNSRLTEKSPDIYTEIVKIPDRIEKLTDEEFHKLEEELGVKEIEQSRSSFGSSLGGDNEDQAMSESKEKKTDYDDDFKLSLRPVAAGRDRKKVSFGTAEDEQYADGDEFMVDREIVKRKKISSDKTEDVDNFEIEVEETTQELIVTEAKIEQKEEEKQEKVQDKYDDEPYEIKVAMPDLSNRKSDKSFLKQTSKSIIRLATNVPKKQEEIEEKPKRERIDINSLKPKFNKRVQFQNDESGEEDNEEDAIMTDDWMASWCILKPSQLKKYETVFDEFDYMDKGYLNGENLIYALEKASRLTNLKMTYLMRVMSMLETDPFKTGATKRTFCVMAALGNRIKHLDDDWFLNMLPKLDAKSVENKIFKAKKLWLFLVDKGSKMVQLNDLMIELKCGGVTDDHVKYAQEKFQDKKCFDLLDYLTYIPLFVHIHEKIIFDPFDEKNPI